MPWRPNHAAARTDRPGRRPCPSGARRPLVASRRRRRTPGPASRQPQPIASAIPSARNGIGTARGSQVRVRVIQLVRVGQQRRIDLHRLFLRASAFGGVVARDRRCARACTSSSRSCRRASRASSRRPTTRSRARRARCRRRTRPAAASARDRRTGESAGTRPRTRSAGCRRTRQRRAPGRRAGRPTRWHRRSPCAPGSHARRCVEIGLTARTLGSARSAVALFLRRTRASARRGGAVRVAHRGDDVRPVGIGSSHVRGSSGGGAPASGTRPRCSARSCDGMAGSRSPDCTRSCSTSSPIACRWIFDGHAVGHHRQHPAVAGYCFRGCDRLNEVGSLTFWMTGAGHGVPARRRRLPEHLRSPAPAPSNRQSRISHRSGSVESSSGPASAAPLE